MENVIQGHKDFVRSQIEKSFGEEIDFEKAHNVGDVHPNGKWVWTEYAPGKFDWRNRKAKTNAQPSERKSVETKSATKSNPEAAKKVLDFLQLSNNKFNDITKVGALKTDKGNWSLSYDGHDVCIVGGNSLSEKTLKDAGVKIEGSNGSDSNNAAKIVKKDVPHKDLDTYKEVVDYAQTLGYDLKEVPSGFRDKNAKAFELKYNDNLSLNVDFVNNHEYIYEFKNNDKHVFGFNSTRETEKTDWSVLLNPNSWAEKTISAYDNGLKQHTSLMKRYKTAYDRMDRRSDYDKYLHEKGLVEYFTNLKTKAGKVVKLFNQK